MFQQLIDTIKALFDVPIYFVKELSPFGQGSLTTNGVQYCTEVGGLTHAAFSNIETITWENPSKMDLVQIEFSLTGAVKSSGATKYVKWKWQASDNGADWEDLIAEQTRAADASAYLDVSCSGKFKPTGDFLGTKSNFKVRFVILAEDANETVTGKTKNSSYIKATYWRP